jgi:hypothetical protein
MVVICRNRQLIRANLRVGSQLVAGCCCHWQSVPLLQFQLLDFSLAMRRFFFSAVLLASLALATAHTLQSWSRHEFRKAKLSVLIPAGTLTETNTKNDDAFRYEVSVTSSEGINYAAEALKFRGRVPNGEAESAFRDEFYRKLAAEYSNTGAEIVNQREIELNGLVGIEYDLKFAGTNLFMYTRTIYHEGRAITLVLGRNGDWPNNFYTDTFFGSPRWED